MFNQKDKTYARMPQMMSVEVADILLARIEEHAKTNNLEKFTISLHGGEPTLWPLSSFAHFLEKVEEIRARGLNLFVLLQTNGYYLNHDLLRLLANYKVSVSVSLDGPKRFNDIRRITLGGGGSYDEVMENLKLLLRDEYHGLLKGVLCVADPDIPPAEFFEWIDSLPIRKIDILWPIEFNHRNFPWASTEFENYCHRPRFGEWFSELFRLWWKRDDPSFYIRLFVESLLVLLGSAKHTDMIVNDTLDMLVINTDGSIEYHDFLRAHNDGATQTKFNIRETAFNDLRNDEVFCFLHSLGSHLPKECHSCDVAQLCGGGFLPGRMDIDSKLPVKRSVLCPDQYRFFKTVYEVLKQQGVELKTQNTESSGDLPPFVERLNTKRLSVVEN